MTLIDWPLRYLIPLILVGMLPFRARAQADTAGASADTVAASVTATDSAATGQTDAALEARMRAVFGSISTFEKVQVNVHNGVARLSGTVPGSEARERAEALAARFPGVLYVDNQIEEATDVETRVTPAVDRVQTYWDRTVATLPAFAIALVVLVLFGLLARFVSRWEAPFERLGISPLVHSLVRRLLGMIFFGLGLVLAFDILDITTLVGAVLGTAGVVGLALGFAFQDIVENYLAGVLLSVRQPFAVGDLIDVGEYQGKVIRLTARELVMMTVEGNHLRLPNATVFKSPMVNYTRNPRRRFSFDVGIGNAEDLNAAMDLGQQTLQAMKGVMDDPAPYARIQELSDSSVLVRFYGWVDQRAADFAKVRSEALRLVKTALDAGGFDLPEPIYRVNLIQTAPPEPKAAPAAQPSVEAEARAIDVSVDTGLDEQIQEDIAASDEQNLLSK